MILGTEAIQRLVDAALAIATKDKPQLEAAIARQRSAALDPNDASGAIGNSALVGILLIDLAELSAPTERSALLAEAEEAITKYVRWLQQQQNFRRLPFGATRAAEDMGGQWAVRRMGSESHCVAIAASKVRLHAINVLRYRDLIATGKAVDFGKLEAEIAGLRAGARKQELQPNDLQSIDAPLTEARAWHLLAAIAPSLDSRTAALRARVEALNRADAIAAKCFCAWGRSNIATERAKIAI